MRCISFVIFLTFSSCFVVLPALENVTQADEIELLERKLEYQTQALKLLKAKKELGLKLEIIEAKIKKLNQDYSDVVDTKAAVSASSTSEAPETSEPTEPAKVQAQMNKFDGDWEFRLSDCGGGKGNTTVTASEISGVINIPRAGTFTVSGSIDKDGKLNDVIAVGMAKVKFKGQLQSDSGRGAFVVTRGGCSGTWKANRE